ncbi:DEAD/DEAH box helicase [Methanorbis rubei]|uniref:ATP-dependent RNA helicase DbpA n=1 Tax=Methanorbis rubei TaxID=3028300 RepID=A0AAE4MGM2_9EURY|nr:ATP-dependent RNA helicase DbpA [Methanocorpusculaceae archaeon Cs1]
MVTVVQPYKKGYKTYFCDDSKNGRIKHVGTVELEQTSKGVRPSEFFVRRPGTSHAQKTPTKELITVLRSNGMVQLTETMPEFQEFLDSMQIPWERVTLCRTCMFDDRLTLLSDATRIKCGQEFVCLDCAKRELRRELAHIKRLGKKTQGHIEDLLEEYRDLDMVLAILQPDSLDTKKTMFDRLEAHEQTPTERIENLPLPREFVDVCGVETLMPAQQRAVESGLLFGKDLLVVAATASGKTFIGEMAGLKNYLEKRGRMLFLVPLVALANQKYDRFSQKYEKLASTSLMTGVSRVNLPETKPIGNRGSGGGIVVGTYEGVDNLLRKGSAMHNIGTIVIDEVQMLEDPERGHRLDGLIARLKYVAPKAQFLYLSATIGSPHLLAKKLGANLVSYADRPVALERHLIFTERDSKVPYIKKLVFEEYDKTSSKGFRGQTIIFANARSRCHTISDAIGKLSAPYHAGLTSQERRAVERQFEEGKLACVVTTAALAAGVDFPASQVIFDALAMGINWLTVQEFHQMMGRAGRPDFHDLGRVVILAEPGGSYSRDTKLTEEEVAIRLLKGEMEEVAPVYEIEETSEEFAANAIVCRGREADIIKVGETMVGCGEDPLPDLLRHKLVKKSGGVLELSPLGRVMAEQFIGMERLLEIDRLVRMMDDPLELIAELECSEEERGKERRKADRRASEKKESDWMAGKKTAPGAGSSEKKPKSDAPPAWVAEKKSASAAAKRVHETDRRSRAGKPEPERKLRREREENAATAAEAAAPRRASRELEERIERKKREAASFIPAPKRKREAEWDAIEAGIDQRRAGKYDDALKILGSYVADHPSNSRALTELGKVYDLRGDRDTAYSCYQRAVSADTQNREAIDRMNAYLIGITVDIDADVPADRQSTGVVKKKQS